MWGNYNKNLAQFQKPENALKRAEGSLCVCSLAHRLRALPATLIDRSRIGYAELIAVGQRSAALETLEAMIKSKRHRTWQITMEKIMFKFLELCVELRMGKRSKDGIIQYRMICQQTNVGSLETVIKHFLRLAEERAKEAQEAADKITLDIDDLEAEESPESIMLSSVSGEDSKERSDREHVTPWLKFLWETYRSVLEILRNNAKLEQVYQETAQQAFSFCLRYKRHTEFRRLCEILRTHLNNISKYQSQPQNISLNSPESLQLHLQTRFSQLNAATELDLWQESYKTIEDIHGLMLMAKKPPKSAMMATYFGKLAEIFWKSDNFLFHAVALYKLWTLHKNSSKISPEELTHLATSLMLASLVSALSQRPCEHTECLAIDSPVMRQLFVYTCPSSCQPVQMLSLR
jgi:translation initiation factor 3 subunit A